MRYVKGLAVLLLVFCPLVSLGMELPANTYFPYLYDPNFTYALLLFALYSIFFEMLNPGMIIPGLLGFISLIFVLYAFMWLPVDYSSLTLLLIGMAFMVFEAYMPTFGFMGILGVLAFMLGSYSLFDMSQSQYHVSVFLILTMAALSLAFIMLIVFMAIRSYKKAIISGKEGLIGKTGIVIVVNDDKTTVRVLGEMWNVTSKHKLHRDQLVKVTHVHDLTLTVEPIPKNIQEQN